MEIQKPSRRRRHYPEEFKRAVIEACCEPGGSVAGLALTNGVNANQVQQRMRKRGIEQPTRRRPMPVIEATPALGEIQIEVLWLSTRPLNMRAGTETILAQIVRIFSATQPHRAYLFANCRSTRLKVLRHDGYASGWPTDD